MAASKWAPRHLSAEKALPGKSMSFAWSGLQDLTIVRKPSEGPYFTKTCPQSSWTPGLRKLVNQSFDTFCNVQDACKSSGDPVARMHTLIESSKIYRVWLQNLVGSIRAERGLLSELVQHHVAGYSLEPFESWELVWHLCEILHLERLSAGYLVQKLLEWVSRHTSNMDALLAEVMEQWDAHPHYWDLVYGLVFQGRMKEACTLLDNNSRRGDHKSAYSRMIALLQRWPITKSLDGVTYQELVRVYSEWKLECKRRLGDFVQNAHLSDLCSILSGDESAFNKVAGSYSRVFTHWYQVAVANLLFADPLVEASDYLVSQVAEMHYKGEGEIDKMIRATFLGDIIELIKLSSSSFGNWWFVAHLTDLLYHSEVLEAAQIQHRQAQREFLLLEYASSLFNHSSLWQLGVEYLAHCPTQGRSVLALLVGRIPLDSDKKAHKVLHICERFKLKEQGKCVCRVMAVRSIKAGRMGSALEWAIGAKDSQLICHIAESYMLDYQHVGRMRDMKVLRTLDQTFLSTDLTFLGKYCQFVAFFEQERYEQAGSILVELLTAEIVPKKFWLTLMTDALPLLDQSETISLSKEQTEQLCMCLEDLLRSHSPLLTKEMEEQVGIISLALSHNVSSSLS